MDVLRVVFVGVGIVVVALEAQPTATTAIRTRQIKFTFLAISNRIS